MVDGGGGETVTRDCLFNNFHDTINLVCNNETQCVSVSLGSLSTMGVYFFEKSLSFQSPFYALFSKF